MEIVILIWLMCGIAAAYVAQGRAASAGLWFVIGFLFGPIGLACAFASRSGVFCTACRKSIHPDATKCPFCQSYLGELER